MSLAVRRLRALASLASLALIASGVALAASGGAADAATSSTTSAGAGGAKVTTRMVPGGERTNLGRGGGGAGEVAPEAEEEALAGDHEPVANRSLSANPKFLRGPAPLSGIPASNSAVTGPAGAASYTGINHHQQRYEVAGGNQWSLEPPDQALCVGGGYVFEAVNNAIAVYDTAGNRLALKSLNEFFNYPVEIDRTAGVAGPKQTTDPTCLFDPATNRFFLTILTYDADELGNPVAAGTNTLDTAVSSTSNPLGAWTISHIDATDDGSNGTQNHAGCPCIGDYPHIGVDANGYYVTTNEYPWATESFNGAQIYAMSKAQLVSGATSVRVTQVDTTRAAPGGKPGFTVWPAQSPTAAQYDTRAGGTEYFLSSNAAEEAQGEGGTDESDEILTWSVTNTASLAAGQTPNLGVHVTSTPVGEYAVPLPAEQKAGPVPLADCLNLTSCAKFVWGTPDKYKEREGVVATNDTRMQQVSYANGTLYGSLGTALDVGASSSTVAQQAGIAWYMITPTTAANGNLSASLLHQGRVAVARNNLAYPALGARADGSAVMAATLVGKDHYPSAAYVDVSSVGATGPVHVLAEGVGPQDGFTEYRINGDRPRWGDYGAAAVTPSGTMWVASEWIGQSCTFQQYLDTKGECGGTRTYLANWSTRFSRVNHP